MQGRGTLLAVGLTAAVMLFAVQNLTSVPVAFLMWRTETSVSLIVLGPFLVGLLVGAVAGALRRGRASPKTPPTPPGPPDSQA